MIRGGLRCAIASSSASRGARKRGSAASRALGVPWSREPVTALLTLVALGLACGAWGALSPGGFSPAVALTREDSRLFYISVYQASTNVPMAWTGSLSRCLPGTVSADFLTAGQRKLNYFRALAGVPSNVTSSAAHNALAQQVALLMARNSALSHVPPPTWGCYNRASAAAAATSNLALGTDGVESVRAWMADDNVPSLGHRRWEIFPPLNVVGQGSAENPEAGTVASALYYDPNNFVTPRPATRDAFVAWPPKGYLPRDFVPSMWSFSYPNAGFATATVQLTRNGVAVPVTVSLPDNGYGDNTIAWTPTAWLVHGTEDVRYTVAVQGVMVGSTRTNFNYNVVVFDPSTKDRSSVQPTVRGPARVSAQRNSTFTIGGIRSSFVDGYDLRATSLASYSARDGAETGLANFIVEADTTFYSVVDSSVKAAGNAAFHLAQPTGEDQTLTWRDSLYIADRAASLKFQSRLGWATPTQTALVEVSTDDGNTWTAVFRRPGTGIPGQQTFTPVTVPLRAFLRKSVRLRFRYANLPVTGTRYRQTDVGVGWYIDDIIISRVLKKGNATVQSVGRTRRAQFIAPQNGRFLLQARATAFGQYPLEWGPGLIVNAV